MPPLQLIFHDIDGCLNGVDGEDFSSGQVAKLSEGQRATLQALGALLDQHHIDLVLNTGRDLSDSRHIAEGLKCKGLKLALLEHSAYAWDFRQNREIDLGALAQQQGDFVRAEKYRSLRQIEDLLAWYKSIGRRKLSKKMGTEAPMALGKKSNLSISIVPGWTAKDLMELLKNIVDEYYPKAQDQNFQYCHSQCFVDILGPIHKSDGAVLLARHLGVRPENTLVVGDGMNDMDMFRHWPHLLCPSNAYPALKDLCQQSGGEVSKYAYVEATRRYLGRILEVGR